MDSTIGSAKARISGKTPFDVRLAIDAHDDRKRILAALIDHPHSVLRLGRQSLPVDKTVHTHGSAVEANSGSSVVKLKGVPRASTR